MAEGSVHTTQLRGWLDRMQAGDRAARDELFRAVGGRLERLARQMFKDYPSVQRWAEVDDVLQNAVLRLLRALEAVRPTSTRDFFNLAAVQVRRELVDQARHFAARRERLRDDAPGAGPPSAVVDPADRADLSGDLERWCAFHEAVERLPVEEREVVGLVFYHGWTQADVADLFDVSERTVRRWWCSALVRLHDELGGDLPLS
jgi:RNA polymerase sigma-70 factor (ECF subfamily)